MDGHLTKTRGGKKGQIRPMVRFRFLFSGTGDNRTRQLQRSIYISSNPVCAQLKTLVRLSAICKETFAMAV
jgi:DNA-binding HxlR family transcriptional regulator